MRGPNAPHLRPEELVGALHGREPDVEVCRTCRGSGREPGAFYQDGRPVPCEDCGGTGLLSEAPTKVFHVTDSDVAGSEEHKG